MKRRHIIGMFDSGVGGLTVMKEILEQLPNVRIIYFGDTARVPYGNRSREELIRFGEEIITFLIGQGAEAIVVACNTSSANAIPLLKERFDIPLIGTIEPGARLAVKTTKNGKVGLIATEATVRSKAYSSAISRVLAKGILPEDRELREAWQRGEQSISLVKAQACPLFVPLVEAGLANSPEAQGIARTYLTGLESAEVDALILGCTHYPFLVPVLRNILGDKIQLVDPAQPMLEELKRVLESLDEKDELLSLRGNRQEEDYAVPALSKSYTKAFTKEYARQYTEEQWQHRFYVSGDPELFKQVGETFLPGEIRHVSQVTWED